MTIANGSKCAPYTPEEPRTSLVNVLVTDGWMMQWRRVNRSYNKLAGVYHDTEVYDDDVYHFFQDAWHLKDWIGNDNSLGIGSTIESEIKKIRSLRIAADFANGTKHLLLKFPRPENAQFTERKVTVMLGSPKAEGIQERILTLSDGTTITTETLAAQVMKDWKQLLTKLALLP